MKKIFILLLGCVTILSTTGIPSASYSNVRLQKSKPSESPPSVGSSIPNNLLSNPHLADEPPAADSIFEKAMENLKNAPQDDDTVLGKRNERDAKWNENTKGNGLNELRNSKDIEKGIIENFDGINQHYDDFLESGSGKLEQEFDDDNAANDKFDYIKSKKVDESSGSENKDEDDLEKSNSFIGIYNGGCCGGYGGWGGWNGGWGGGRGGGWGGGWGGVWGGGWGGGWGGWGGAPWYG